MELSWCSGRLPRGSPSEPLFTLVSWYLSDPSELSLAQWALNYGPSGFISASGHQLPYRLYSWSPCSTPMPCRCYSMFIWREPLGPDAAFGPQALNQCPSLSLPNLGSFILTAPLSPGPLVQTRAPGHRLMCSCTPDQPLPTLGPSSQARLPVTEYTASYPSITSTPTPKPQSSPPF